MQYDYFIKCESCDEPVAEADNLQKLFEIFFKNLAEHNHDINEICGGAKDEISMDDVRWTFAGEDYQIYKATKHEKRAVEWEKAGYRGLKNE